MCLKILLFVSPFCINTVKARYASAEKNVKDLNLSVDLLKKESIKLLQRTALAEKEMKYGHSELMYVLLVSQ